MAEQAIQYTATEGDFIDWVVWQHYGHVDVALETVMNHPKNRHLRNLSEELPQGTKIVLPKLELNEKRLTRLWD